MKGLFTFICLFFVLESNAQFSIGAIANPRVENGHDRIGYNHNRTQFWGIGMNTWRDHLSFNMNILHLEKRLFNGAYETEYGPFFGPAGHSFVTNIYSGEAKLSYLSLQMELGYLSKESTLQLFCGPQLQADFLYSYKQSNLLYRRITGDGWGNNTDVSTRDTDYQVLENYSKLLVSLGVRGALRVNILDIGFVELGSAIGTMSSYRYNTETSDWFISADLRIFYTLN